MTDTLFPLPESPMPALEAARLELERCPTELQAAKVAELEARVAKEAR